MAVRMRRAFLPDLNRFRGSGRWFCDDSPRKDKDPGG